MSKDAHIQNILLLVLPPRYLLLLLMFCPAVAAADRVVAIAVAGCVVLDALAGMSE